MALIKPARESEILEPLAAVIHKRVYRDNGLTPQGMLHAVMLAALANWELLEPVYLAQVRHASLEGFDLYTDWLTKAANLRRKLKKVRGRRVD